MFKRKKVKKEEQPQETETVEAKSDPEPQIDPVLKEMLEDYSKDYADIITPDQLARMSDVQYKAIQLNLLFAVYGELRKLNME